MFADAQQINPPETYSPWLWVVAVLTALAAVAVVLVARRLLRSPEAAEQVDVESLRAAALRRIDAIASETATGDRAEAMAAAEIGLEVRRFLGTVTQTDLDYTTSGQWERAAERDPGLRQAVDFLRRLSDGVFPPAGRPVLQDVRRHATTVVSGWR